MAHYSLIYFSTGDPGLCLFQKLENFSVHHIGLHKRQIMAGVGNDSQG